jgi:hypothetical protein
VFTGVVHGSGTTTGAGAATLTLSVPLQLGDIYAAAQPGYPELWPRYLAPHQSHGFTESISPSLHIVELGPRIATRCETPNPRFSVPISLRADSLPAEATQWSAILVVGTVGDIQPVGGGQYGLFGPVMFSETINYDVGDPTLTTATEAPITDPALAGAVVYVQWWVSVGSSFKLSNIAGVMIRNGVFDPLVYAPGAAARSASSGLTKRSPMDAAMRRRLRDWLLKCGGQPMSAAQRGVMLKAVVRKGR